VAVARPGELAAARRELAGLASRADALRQAAALPGAELKPVVDAALAELDGVIGALRAEPDQTAAGDSPRGAQQSERRLLHSVFQQAPVPLFLLSPDGTVRRVNAAAGDLLGSGPGYATGKRFTAFIDVPWRAPVQTQLVAVTRTGSTCQVRCQLLGASGTIDCELTVRPVTVRGDTDQVIVAITGNGSALAATDPAAAGQAGSGAGQAGPAPGQAAPGDENVREADAGVVAAVTRRIDLVTAAARLLLGNATLGESVTLQRCARLLVGGLAAWVIVDLERGGQLRRHYVAGPDDPESAAISRVVAAVDPAPGSAPYQVHESGSSLLAGHSEDVGVLGAAPDGTPLLMMLGAASLLCVPLSNGEQVYGVLTLARPASEGSFAMAEAGMAEELGEQLALAIRLSRIFRRQAEIAEALQASLHPRELTAPPGVEIAATHVAATDGLEVGGDFYDSYPTSAGWGIAIGDACGSGEDTAADTAAARHAIRVTAYSNPDPAGTLRTVNDIMLAADPGDRFVTAAAGQLCWRDGALRVALGSAGHPAPLLVGPDGHIRMLAGGGLPLGIFPDAEPAAQQLDLGAGQVLFFFTDGVTGARNPQLASFEDRLVDELAARASGTAADIVSGIRDAVLGFTEGKLREGITMLALRAGRAPDS
jgi:serine phosphatase RsbU (regulator of sigma subunit)/PAS domain-containing protein